MSQTEVILILGAGGLLLFSFFVIVPWRIKRAIPKLIQLFRDHNATRPTNAMTYDELGIKTSVFSLRLLKDYKKESLDVLMRLEIVQLTEDGRLFLLEDKLMNSKLYKLQSYPR